MASLAGVRDFVQPHVGHNIPPFEWKWHHENESGVQIYFRVQERFFQQPMLMSGPAVRNIPFYCVFRKVVHQFYGHGLGGMWEEDVGEFECIQMGCGFGGRLPMEWH